MKIINTLAAGLLLCIGLTSCEMKDELIGNKNEDAEMGYLDLGVAVNGSVNIVTKANDNDVVDDGEQTGSSISAEDFPVIIEGTTVNGNEYTKEFKSYKALKEENPIELPVGEYTVKAHSNLEEKKQMPEPFYEGTTDVSITKGQESKTEVKCTMKNTKIQLVYPETFLADFASWTITLDDGNDNTLFFTESEKNPAAVYWMISANVNKLKVNVNATTTEGESITESRVLEKPEGGNTAYWTGGDALTITMESYTPDPEDPTGVSGIDISVDVTFDETEDKVEVPVTPSVPEGGDTEEPEEPSTNPDEPENPSGELPSITFPQTTYTLPADASMNADAVITSTAEGGIQSVVVQIIAGNEDFGSLTPSLGFDKGVELVGDPTGLGTVIQSVLPGMEDLKMPALGDSNYSFPVGGFFNILTGMGVTTEDGHIFNITVKDANGESFASLNVKVTE